MQELHDLGLSMPQVIAMHVLLQSADASRLETEGLGMHALGEALRLSPSAITTLVDKLVERQLVERWENPGDRRQKQVRLRPAGIELLHTMREIQMELHNLTDMTGSLERVALAVLSD